MKESRVDDKAMLLLRRKVNVAGMWVHTHLVFGVHLTTVSVTFAVPNREKSNGTPR